MKKIRIAAVSLNQTARDWYGNQRRIASSLKSLQDLGVAVGCLPELCITGYGCEDGFTHQSTLKIAEEVLSELLPLTDNLVVNFGLPLLFKKAIYNCTVVVADKKILGVVPKKSLAGDGIHYEPRWFKPWPHDVVSETTLCGSVVPIGDLIFNVSGVRIGYEICEEAWTGERPGIKHSKAAVDIECNPSASHFALSKKAVRKNFVTEGSRAFGCAYIYSNLLGVESGRQIYDGGNLIAFDGEVIAEGERFSYQDIVVTAADIDLEYNRTLYAKKHWSAPLLDTPTIIEIIHNNMLNVAKGELSNKNLPDWESTEEDREFEEFTRAIPFALFEYLRKSRSNGFVISLSGGCDSSAVAVLVKLCYELAYGGLGKKEFKEKLSYIKNLSDNIDDVIENSLITIWQETENNSEQTKKSAAQVASCVKSTHYEVVIDPLVASYVNLCNQLLNINLNFKNYGLVLQNLQARVRAPLPWTIANVKNFLLLTTSNRSESALGYCTMDGDTAGGLNPIGGIDKDFLRRWLKWMESSGGTGLTPLPELNIVNALTPSAELLPLDSKQTDEGELGPYEVVSVIEERFMRHGESPKQILSFLEVCFKKTYSREDLKAWLVKFFQLFARNQWKRERLAPCFHVDNLNLDPRTWCRWPILSGGFERELEELIEN